MRKGGYFQGWSWCWSWSPTPSSLQLDTLAVVTPLHPLLPCSPPRQRLGRWMTVFPPPAWHNRQSLCGFISHPTTTTLGTDSRGPMTPSEGVREPWLKCQW